MFWDNLSTCLLLIIAGSTCSARDSKIVDNWAENLGSELWELANAVARPDELKAKYKEMNARVEDKSGDDLIMIISESVGRMLRRKMDAVRCILRVAEDAAEVWNDTTSAANFSYYSGKLSPVDGEENPITNKSTYRLMELNPDSHFYDIPVNTNYSSVHIPTNVHDLSPVIIKAIKWSEALDDIFRQNYRSDPALSWQYFGSMTGMFRQYPAMQWRTSLTAGSGPDPDLYDCRIRSWFIEAATCSKDMVILIDSSGSMTGMGLTIARAVVNSILDTLSNNDFVTILQYTNVTDEIVPCFKDKLIQATPENLLIFRNMIKNIYTLEQANLTEAFSRAFDLLKVYRETRGCGPETPCNQLIMVVTDGVASDLPEVFNSWNRMENGSIIPVRIFTYLLGKEVTKVREIQDMACQNRGYYTHVHTQEEAQEQVLKYIPVIARPLVLQAVEHPVAWTHVSTDVSNPGLAYWLWLVMESPPQSTRLEKYLEERRHGVSVSQDATYITKLNKGEDVRQEISTLNTTKWQEYRLFTSVSIPVFDRKGNRNNETKLANLLGVAGTDVPIEQIQKLTLPYKLGVNGYAFIVSNNGYVILHPDLRPVSGGRLKLNYNSVDLSEVEILDDGRLPRDPGPEVLRLRQALVDHEHGNLTDVPVKFHYDDNRRVSLEKRDYYFAPLPGTPFGIAVAIPNYGKTWIKVGNEIEKNHQAGINISEFFIGNHWRVHPSWVYCRFHYLEGHEFPNSEAELIHFIRLLGEPGWEWSEQYTEDEVTLDDDEPDCGRQVFEDDAYYCNEELVQLLVFDAKATNQSFAGDFQYRNEHSKKLGDIYEIILRFVATQSGLTRWQYVDPKFMINHKEAIEFGDLHRRAVNEAWYKGAIFQHRINPDSVSLTVPWNAGSDAIVTASMAIFPRDGGKNASAAVVGFQIPMKALFQRFIDITSNTTNPELDCSRQEIECYLIDQNGFIVIAEARHDDTGKFMGVVEGAVMKSMISQGYFIDVDVYDYQALCKYYGLEGGASFPTNILRHIWNLLLWMFARLLWMTSQFINIQEILGKVQSDDDLPEKPKPPNEVKLTYACDQKRTLFMLNQTAAAYQITNSSIHQCSRPYYAQLVPYTNLVLVVVNALYDSCYERLEVLPVQISPLEYVNSTEEELCYKMKLNDLPRRRLEDCFTEHPEESEIKLCGKGIRLQLIPMLIFISSILGYLI